MKRTYYFTALALGVALIIPSVMPSHVQAAGLSESQVQAIVTLVKTFGVDENIVARVENALRGVIQSGVVHGNADGTAEVDAGVGIVVPVANAAWRHAVCRRIFAGEVLADRGDFVRELQEFLAGEGLFGAGATGFFGPITREALGRWQAAHGLVIAGDVAQGWGVFGPRTREQIRRWCGEEWNAGRLQAEPKRGVAPLTVTFKADIALANPAMIADAGSYKIVFGDTSEHILSCSGAAGTCPGPHTVEHTYLANGNYTATLVQYGYFAPPSDTQEVPQRTLGVAVIHVGDKSVCNEAKPVCGSKPIVCITTPCDPVQQTYRNRCELFADNASFLHEGECSSAGATNKPPVISGFTGPTTLKVDEVGTWSVNASDPENAALSYRILWGDERPEHILSAVASPDTAFTQTSSFTHAYNSPGVYTVMVTVRDPEGKEARMATTVKVGGEFIACTLEYNPVCGQPPEPACRNAEPACMVPTPAPKTYSNTCFLNAAGATLLYGGQCKDAIAQPAPLPDNPELKKRICPLLTIKRDLRMAEGAEGDDVLALQEFLHALGFLTVAPTGYFGPLTNNALLQWQRLIPATTYPNTQGSWLTPEQIRAWGRLFPKQGKYLPDPLTPEQIRLLSYLVPHNICGIGLCPATFINPTTYDEQMIEHIRTWCEGYTVPPVEAPPVICTMDAKQCPDGSYVGRTGPNCAFVCPDIEATDIH